MSSAKKDGLSIIGLGAAACLACCAGPVLAFLGGLSIAGLAGTVLFGAIGLLIAMPAIVAFVVVRRRRASCAVPVGSVAVDPPSRKVPSR